MRVHTRIALLIFILAAALSPVESHAAWGDGDRNVGSCTSNSDFRSVISIGSNIDICIATSVWSQAAEQNGTGGTENMLQNRLKTALSTFCGGLGKVTSGQTSTGGGSKVKGDRHYVWVTASVRCTWM